MDENLHRIFNLDPQLLQDAIILAVNIFILFLLGSYLLFNPVRNLLQKRQEKVEADIEDAKKNKEEAEVLKAQYDEQLKNADKAADQILADARKKALAREEEMTSCMRLKCWKKPVDTMSTSHRRAVMDLVRNME